MLVKEVKLAELSHETFKSPYSSTSGEEIVLDENMASFRRLQYMFHILVQATDGEQRKPP